MNRSSVLIIISALFFGTYGIWSKLMIDDFGEFNQAWIRALIILLILVPLGLYLQSFRKIENSDWKWFAVISLAGGLNQAPYFYGFAHLSIGTATLLFYLALTIGAFIIGGLFFRERITKAKYTALVLSVIGLTIIYQFSLTANQFLAAGSTLLSGFLGAIYVVFSKNVSSKYSEVQILSVVFGTMLLVNLPISLLLGETTPSFRETTAWLGQLGYATAMLLANAAVIAGFRHIEPSIGGLLGLLEVVFAAILGILIFQETVTGSLLLGSFCILIAAGLSDMVALIKNVKEGRTITIV
ncbi:MAG: hypothetical protein A2632_00380 [Candidatus Pacebacteria bacterium RIFCSPHIGHO2_01_FULL_46_16]|nr:MAG: hypothetical protein A2632_00380 [Candidatus Pacebacteria bacterium RIFCSPHIGHO2_01_FULL_46_16]OGJ38745.1 MAG: hypothetical protein A3A82_03395 [Candidatus Pacebacteria bacterium RIFCSPLOWO2_01_FULL_47_12]